jgi:membrane protein
MHAPAATLGRLRDEFRAVPARDLVREVLRCYSRNDLLTYASAIAFQVFFALIPLLLFACGLLGFTGLKTVWTDDVAPKLYDSTSVAAYTLINHTVVRVLSREALFWVTIGFVIAVWEMSGAMRAVMGVFDRIYGSRRKRGFRERYVTSILLAVATGALLLASVAVFTLGSHLWGGFSLLRWPLCALMLFAAIALMVRMAPADRQPLEWVSFGSLLVVVAWLGTSVAFAFYVRNIASYGSIFGALATLIIAFEYLYLAAIAFLTGAQLDAIVRERAGR